jgi:hypothetical protein
MFRGLEAFAPRTLGLDELILFEQQVQISDLVWNRLIDPLSAYQMFRGEQYFGRVKQQTVCFAAHQNAVIW